MADAVLTGLEAWKAKAAEGAAPADARLLKTYAPDQIKAEGDKRQLTFTISTGAVDRDRDTLAVDGWDVADYLKNPVLLWAHDSSRPPIGKAVAVVKRGSALHATFEFVPAEISAFAEEVYQLVKAGFLRAVSVGFMPQEWAFDEERGGFNFKRQALLEVSVVPVPSNPQALLEAKAAGVDAGLVREWAARLLESGQEPTDSGAGTEPPPTEKAAPAGVAAPPVAAVKAGRVLSQANHGRVKAAREYAQGICDRLDEVMSEAGMGEDEDEKSLPAPAPAPRFVVKRTAPRESPAERINRVVKHAVQAQVAAEFRRLTGRLD